ncbi:hypothetical protein F5Y05DRAFT_40278 [Hypoxylon sp. FL0543]|nr:hypothetical protein F5Y05DRAFT_40278 [Hypoxylon sp. FL0543]
MNAKISWALCDPCRVKKIRCGRERPCCSNCRRLGHTCSWTGHGKKPSQTTTLSQSFKALGDRFERVESVVRELQQSLETLHKEKQHSPAIQGMTQTQHDDTSHIVECTDFAAVCDVNLTCPPTLRSLAQDAQRLILAPYCKDLELGKRAGDISARGTLQAIIDCPRDFINSMGDNVAPQMPPLDLVQSMVEPYFECLSTRTTLWTRKGFERILSRAASSDGKCDRAIIVCVNNLFVLTLGAKCLSRKVKRLSPDQNESVNEQDKSPMEQVFLNTFLQNAKHALTRREQLSSPRLLNIQALLSLCLVAQQHWDIDILTSLYHQASHLTRYTGLDSLSLQTRETGYQGDLEDSLNVLSCLCIIGSSVNWASGYQPNFSFAEAAEAALIFKEANSAQTDVDPVGNYQKARFGLAVIEERAFTASYPVPSHGQTFAKIQHDSMTLLKELDNWWSKYGLEFDSRCATIPGIKTELEARYHIVKVLLAWPLQRPFQEDVETVGTSRTCLKILVEAWETDLGLGFRDSLARLVVSYPPIAFYNLLRHVINGCASDDGNDSTEASAHTERDLELLQSYAQFVQQISCQADGHTYLGKIDAFQRSLSQFAFAQRQHSVSTRHELLDYTDGTDLTDMAFDDMFESASSHRGVRNGPVGSLPTTCDSISITLPSYMDVMNYELPNSVFTNIS